MTVLYASQELTIPEIGMFGAKYGCAIHGEVDTYGLEVTGPWMFIGYNLPKNKTDRFVVDFCLPVRETGDYAGKFAIKSTGTFSCASSLYQGKLQHLFTRGYGPLVAEITASGARFTGESREIYHSWIGPESPENRIELQFGIA